MSTHIPAVLELWRVGHHEAPLKLPPRELYAFQNRFDDIARRFRSLYLAESPQTCLRELLADFRPNLAAQQRHLERYGPDAAQDLASQPVTARWRTEHVLIQARVRLHGPLVDLCDLPTRQRVEDRHRDLLLAHGLEHLDLHEITTSRRAVTQTIAGELYDRGVAAIRFPSRLDGNACLAILEERATITQQGDAVLLTDPPPRPLLAVAAAWRLTLEPATSPDWRAETARRRV